MSCNNCGCLDCTRQRGIDRAMNRSNDLDDGWATPIHRSPMAKVEPPNEGQIKAWVQIAHEVFNEYKVSSIPLSTLSSLVAQRIPGLRSENYYRVLAQVAEAIKSHPDFEYRRGRSGGIFKRQVPGGSDLSFVQPVYMELKPATNVPDLITGKLPDNCTCKGCGTGLNTSEKSCWKCGAVQ